MPKTKSKAKDDVETKDTSVDVKKLLAKLEEVESKLEEANTSKPTSSLTQEAIARKRLRTKRAKQAEIMSKEPRVRFIIPLEKGEKAGEAYEVVNINGHRSEYKKGIYVDIPESAAKLLAEHHQVNLGMSDFAEKHKVSNSDDKNAF